MGGIDSSETNPLDYLTSELAYEHFKNGGARQSMWIEHFS